MELGFILLALFALLLRLAASETSEEFLLRHQRAQGDNGLAPLYGLEHDTRIPDEYIVMFNPGYTLHQHFESIGMDLSNATVFQPFSEGYLANLDETLLTHIRLDPGVLFVETHITVQLIEPIESFEYNGSAASDDKRKRYQNRVVELKAPWGLQMLSAAGKLKKTPVEDDHEYDYNWGQGDGVNVYVFDSGYV